jgi:vacuolar-type H+-ATPase subunit I/STV1
VKRFDWINEANNRQRNIAPLDVIRNDAMVEGSLIRGDRHLTSVQRIGSIILGTFYLSFGLGFLTLFIVGIVNGDFYHSAIAFMLPIGFLVMAGFSYMGYKMVRNGIIGGAPRTGGQ